MIDFSTISHWKSRRTPTLCRMWRTLNNRKWPVQFGPRQEPGHSETWKLMQEIAAEVGQREIQRRDIDGNPQA